ncbi:MAG TPA: aspartate aminotransferase family protein, partial [Deltaproteobacteria bacterium]|nr:aspartate aminotransferase family protein [Deltaproteobacteria bacterium]
MRLAAVESRNVTCQEPLPPIFWERAHASNVWDADGNRFVDLGAGFGVAGVGHAHPRVVEAVARQLARLPHAMGDVHPAVAKVELLEALAARFPGGVPARSVLGSSGSDAVEIALKTALLATGRPGLVAFEGAYHGVHQGAVSLTSSRHYLEFAGVPRQRVFRLPYPYSYRFPFPVERRGDESKIVLRYLEHLIEDEHSGLDDLAGIIVEPVEGEGGYIPPPGDFLPGLREIADKAEAPLIIDEVQTGFGRTGKFWGCELTGTTPDIMCV